MTIEPSYESIRDVVWLIGAVLLFYWGKSRKGEQKAIDIRFKAIEKRVIEYHDDVINKFDEANERSSRLTSKVQDLIGRFDRMPEDLRKIFWSHDQGADLKEDFKELKQQLGRRNYDKQ